MFRPIRIAYCLQRMERAGHTSEAVLRDTGINENRLADNTYLIDTWQAQKVMSNMTQLTGDESLGFSITTCQDFCATSLSPAYLRPNDTRHYLKHFDCPIEFNAEQTVMTLVSHSLDAPVNLKDQELRDVCLSHCREVMRGITENRPLAARIRHILLEHCGGIPDPAELAVMLHMSTRSLRRHLQSEGVNYQQLVNQYWADLACQYIIESGLSNKEIGYLLGYQDTKAFQRAFKSWTGKTVGQYRQQAA